MKKSSPKNLSADCRSTVGRQLTDRLPTVYRQVKKKCWPTDGQLSADSRPTGFLGSSSSQLPKSLCLNSKKFLHPQRANINFERVSKAKILMENLNLECSGKGESRMKLSMIMFCIFLTFQLLRYH